MRRRRVGSKNWGFPICIAKIMLKNDGRAGFGSRESDGFGDFKESCRRDVLEGFGL